MSNFWSKHLGGVAPAYQPPAPTYQQPAPPQQYQQEPQQAYEEPVAVPRQAMHARETGLCPGCESSNYFASPTDPRTGKRCYDCGYPKIQSTSGLKMKSEGAATPARQTAENKNSSFHARHVVGRID
jgi:hypothetical protein